MQSKFLNLAIANLSACIVKQEKVDKIRKQDSLKKSDILLSIFTRNGSKQICSAV